MVSQSQAWNEGLGGSQDSPQGTQKALMMPTFPAGGSAAPRVPCLHSSPPSAGHSPDPECGTRWPLSNSVNWQPTSPPPAAPTHCSSTSGSFVLLSLYARPSICLKCSFSSLLAEILLILDAQLIPSKMKPSPALPPPPPLKSLRLSLLFAPRTTSHIYFCTCHSLTCFLYRVCCVRVHGV